MGTFEKRFSDSTSYMGEKEGDKKREQEKHKKIVRSIFS